MHQHCCCCYQASSARQQRHMSGDATPWPKTNYQVDGCPRVGVCFFVVPNTTTSVRYHTTYCVCVPNTVYHSLVRCYVANLPTYRTTTETTCVRENEDRGDFSVASLVVIFEGQKMKKSVQGPNRYPPLTPPGPPLPLFSIWGLGNGFAIRGRHSAFLCGRLACAG